MSSSPGAAHDLRVAEVDECLGEAGQVGHGHLTSFGVPGREQPPPEVGGCSQEADPQAPPFGVDQRFCSVTRSLTVPSAVMSGAVR